MKDGEWESDIIFTPRDRVLSIGKTGTGKSTRMKAALAMAMKGGQRVLVFDPLDEYSQLGRARSSVRLGPLTQRMTMDELAEELELADEDNRPSILEREDLALAVVPMGTEPEEWAADFAALLAEVEAVGDMVLCADELNVWGEYAVKPVKKAACLSRHWGDAGVPLCLGSQRAVGIHPTARAQASVIISGLQDLPPDLDALEERCGKAFAEEVARLAPGEFRVWRDTEPRADSPKQGRRKS